MQQYRSFFIIISCILVAGCNFSEATNQSVMPETFEDSDTCHLCSMMITVHPGPKGQVFNKATKQVHKFCSTSDMMLWYLQGENRKLVSAMYVHDMAQSPWKYPDDNHLIPAAEAYYVIGSKKTGSMGPTLGSFLTESAANNFSAREAGTVLSFDKLLKVLSIEY